LWSDRKASSGVIEQRALRSSAFHETALLICASMIDWESAIVSHLGLPSKAPDV